jgi:hypothetical protein
MTGGDQTALGEVQLGDAADQKVACCDEDSSGGYQTPSEANHQPVVSDTLLIVRQPRTGWPLRADRTFQGYAIIGSIWVIERQAVVVPRSGSRSGVMADGAFHQVPDPTVRPTWFVLLPA